MRYETRSSIIGRSGKRDEDGNGPVFVHLFDHNNPHKSGAVPKQFVDFGKIHKIVFKDLEINFLLAGSDILINNLEYVEVFEEEGKKGNLIVSGRQNP